MKKILGFVLILSVLMQSIVFAEEKKENTADLGLIQALGILKNSEEPGEFITRGEAAVYTARMLKIPLTTSQNVNSVFEDLTPGDIVCDAVCKLAALDIVNGNGTNNFQPNEYIKKRDAISLFLLSIGFSQAMLETSGYINRGNALAKDLGIYISDGRSDDDDITSDTFFNMMLKVLESNMVTIAGGKNGDLIYKISDEEDILSKYHNVKHYQGTVTANYLFSIIGGNKTSRGYIELDGRSYKDEYSVSPELAGTYTDYYIFDEDTLIYLAEGKKNKSLVIDSEKIIKYNNGNYTYDDSGRNKTVQFDFSSKPVIYNYRLLMQYDDRYMRPECGYIHLIDSDNDNKYDVMYVMNYKNFYVTGVVTDNDKLYVYDKSETNNKPLVIDSSDEYGAVVMNTEFKQVGTKSIKTGSVISAFVHEDLSEYTADIVIVSNDTLSGAVKEINPNVNVTNLQEVVIGTQTYSMFGNISAGDLELNNSYIFALDYKGRIADMYVDNDNSVMAIGYIISKRYDVEKEQVQIKLLTELGKIHRYYCSDKTRIHNENSKKNNEELDLYLDGKTGLVGYKVNEDGEIYYLSFPTDWTMGRTNGEIFRVFKNQSMYYFGGSRRSFYNRYVASAKAKVFTIPDNGREEDYRVSSPDGTLVHAETYLVDGYMLSKDSTLLDVVVVHTNTAGSSTISNEGIGNTVSVVQSVKSVWNDEEEELEYELTLIGMHGKQVYTVKDDSVIDMNNIIPGRKGKVSEGDIIRFAVNYKNEIDLIRVIYDANEDDFSGTTALLSNFGAASRPVVGKLYNFANNIVQIADADADISSSFNLAQTESYPIGNAVIVVYDKEESKGNRVRTGKTTDLISYKMASGKCSKVLVDSYQGTARVFVVFK